MFSNVIELVCDFESNEWECQATLTDREVRFSIHKILLNGQNIESLETINDLGLFKSGTDSSGGIYFQRYQRVKHYKIHLNSPGKMVCDVLGGVVNCVERKNFIFKVPHRRK